MIKINVKDDHREEGEDSFVCLHLNLHHISNN